MAEHSPQPISKSELTKRLERSTRIGRNLDFEGTIEYRHVYSQAGGAQYGQAASPDEDLLIVYAEAFERDADPDDFSLEAILAHERGNQLLARHERLQRNLPGGWSTGSEEIVASLLGSLIVKDEKDQQDLLLKAIFEAETRGLKTEASVQLIIELRSLLEKILRWDRRN